MLYLTKYFGLQCSLVLYFFGWCNRYNARLEDKIVISVSMMILCSTNRSMQLMMEGSKAITSQVVITSILPWVIIEMGIMITNCWKKFFFFLNTKDFLSHLWFLIVLCVHTWFEYHECVLCRRASVVNCFDTCIDDECIYILSSWCPPCTWAVRNSNK